MKPCAVRFKLLLKYVLYPELNEIFTSSSPQTLVVGCKDLFPPTSPETLEKQTQRFNHPLRSPKTPGRLLDFLDSFLGLDGTYNDFIQPMDLWRPLFFFLYTFTQTLVLDITQKECLNSTNTTAILYFYYNFNTKQI
jgi:hypothetical protein